MELIFAITCLVTDMCSQPHQHLRVSEKDWLFRAHRFHIGVLSSTFLPWREFNSSLKNSSKRCSILCNNIGLQQLFCPNCTQCPVFVVCLLLIKKARFNHTTTQSTSCTNYRKSLTCKWLFDIDWNCSVWQVSSKTHHFWLKYSCVLYKVTDSTSLLWTGITRLNVARF